MENSMVKSSKFEIVNVMDSLFKDNEVFTSEADFQIHFGMKIIEKYGSRVQVSLEKPFVLENKIVRIDVAIMLDGQIIPVELKYRTKKCKATDPIGMSIQLKTHGAYDYACYAYACDIIRVNAFVMNYLNSSEGYCVFVTNDDRYCLDYHSSKVDYRDFWINTLSDGEKRGQVNGHELSLIVPRFYYMFDGWREIGRPIDGTQFRYKIAKVTK